MKTESEIQSECIDWARSVECDYPELRWLHAIPNGGKRHPATASRLKREGVRRGIPDLFLPTPVYYGVLKTRSIVLPVDCSHGLYIEIKTRKGRLTAEQQQFFEDASANGYVCRLARSLSEFKQIVTEYLRCGHEIT